MTAYRFLNRLVEAFTFGAFASCTVSALNQTATFHDYTWAVLAAGSAFWLARSLTD